jgi:hypothetical protein
LEERYSVGHQLGRNAEESSVASMVVEDIRHLELEGDRLEVDIQLEVQEKMWEWELGEVLRPEFACAQHPAAVEAMFVCLVCA